MDNSSINLTLY